MSTSAPQADRRSEDGTELHRLVEEHAALRRVATLVASGAPSAEVLSAVAQEVAQVMHLPMVGVYRYDNDGLMTVVATWSDRPHVLQLGTRWPLDGPSMVAEVRRTGRPTRVEDYTDLPGALAAGARESALNATAGAPIIVDGSVWGAMGVSSPDGPLPEHVEDRLAEFTELVATAIANSQAHEQLAQLAEEQAALRRVATLVASGAPAGDVFDAVAQEVTQVLRLMNAAVCRYDKDGTALTVLAAHGPRPESFGPGSRWPLDGPSMSAEVLRTGRPVRVEEYSDLSGSLATAAREHGFGRVVGAPIIVAGCVWGVIATSSPDAPFPDDVEDRLAQFTELVGTAIANSEAYEELARLAEEQEALRRVATLVAAGATTADVFDAVSAKVATLIGADGSALSRYEPDGTMITVSGWTSDGRFGSLGIRYTLEGTVAGVILETGRPARFDSLADGDGEARKAARAMGFRSSVGAPVTVDGRVWGVLAVASRSEQPLPRDTERRLSEFAELFATAIANSEAHQQLEQLADEQAALRRVATLVAAGAAPSEVFEAVSAEVAALIGAEGAALTRYEADGTVTALSGWTTEGGYVYVGRRYALEGTVSGVIAETGRPGRIDNYGETPGEATEAALQMGWRSSVGAPITVQGRLWGALAVSSRTEKPLPLETERRLSEFAELFATAIANSEAHERLAELADEQAALRRVATLVAEGAAPHWVFDAVRHEVARVFGAHLSVLLRYDGNGTATVLATSHNYLGPIGRSWPVDDDVSAIAQVCRTGLPARADYTLPSHGPIVDAAREVGARSAIGVPVVVDGTLWGVMAVGSRDTEPMPADFEVRLAKFTELLATAIANAEGRAALDASRARIVATADATRRRIERDLHDGAQQQLVWLALALRAAQATVPDELEEHRSELGRVVDGLTDALDDLREVALGIHPAGLSEDGLTPALKRLVARSPLRVNLDCPSEGRFPGPVEVAAYYVVSEALTNATKYADAPAVDVTVTTDGEALRVEVRDGGRGGADPASGSGLLGLRDRVEAIGGTMHLTSPPDAGTTLRVDLPLSDQA